jgi:hypothetical protein
MLLFEVRNNRVKHNTKHSHATNNIPLLTANLMSRSHFVPSLEAYHKTRHMLHISISTSHQLTEQYTVKPFTHSAFPLILYTFHSWLNALKNNATLSCTVGSQFFLVSTMEFAQFYAARFSSQNSLLASNKPWLLSSQWHHQKPTYGTHHGQA